MPTSREFRWSRTVVTLFMFAGSILFLLPFVWMLVTSFKMETDVFTYPIQWIPKKWNAVANYKEVWFGGYPFYLYYWNSIKISVLTTLTSCTVSALAAYGFSKIKFAASSWLFMIVLVTYMIPGQAILIPQFILYRNIGLFDSHFGMIILGSFSVLGTFMLRQFFMGIHQDYIESAKMDGAGHGRIFRSIALPLVKRRWPPTRFCGLSGPGTITRIRSFSCGPTSCSPCRWRCRSSRP